MSENKRYEGKTIWFNPKDGFGFIGWEGKQDMFVHFSGIISDGFRTLKKGQTVEFEIGENNQGKPIAINVVVTGDAEEDEE